MVLKIDKNSAEVHIITIMVYSTSAEVGHLVPQFINDDNCDRIWENQLLCHARNK